MPDATPHFREVSLDELRAPAIERHPPKSKLNLQQYLIESGFQHFRELSIWNLEE